jgi:hypothetical protein
MPATDLKCLLYNSANLIHFNIYLLQDNRYIMDRTKWIKIYRLTARY